MKKPARKYPEDTVDLTLMNRRLNHRLRNFCTGMQMVVQAIETYPQDQAKILEKCPLVQAELDRLMTLTRRLDLLFEVLPPAAEMSVADLMENARFEFAHDFPLCNLDIDAPLTKGPLSGGGMLDIALKELLANAGTAAGVDGSVTLRWDVESGDTICITNTGEQLPDDLAIDPPVPFASNRSRHDGIGLAIVHRVLNTIDARWTIRNNADHTVTASICLEKGAASHE